MVGSAQDDEIPFSVQPHVVYRIPPKMAIYNKKNLPYIYGSPSAGGALQTAVLWKVERLTEWLKCRIWEV